MKVRTLTVGLLVSSLALTACGKSGGPGDSASAISEAPASNVKVEGSPTFDKISQRGKIVIGAKQDQPGLGRLNPTTNKYEGFDIQIAQYVAAQLGYGEDKIEFKPIQSLSREQAIANGDVDLYVGTYTINEKRKEQVSFAGPYFVAGQDLLVRKDDTSITGPESLKGKKVCSVTGSTPIQRVRDQQLTQPNNIIEFQGYADCVNQLIGKQIDAVTTDDAILKGYAAEEPDKLKLAGKPFSTEPYGIGLVLNDKALRNKIDDILQKAIDDGTWKKIYDGTLGKSGSSAEPPKIERY